MTALINCGHLSFHPFRKQVTVTNYETVTNMCHYYPRYPA
jgi:hypothetical protein